MKITQSMMYWVTRMDGIHETCTCVVLVGLCISLLVCLAYFIALTEHDENIAHKIKSALRWIFLICIVGGLGAIFIPTTREMAMIYVIPNIAESQVIKQDVPELYNLGVNALKNWLENEQPKGK